MPSIVTRSQKGDLLNIAISGRFDFSILQSFRDAYSSDIEEPIAKVLIDLSNSEHMDSSGMGLLLTLKKELQLEAGSIEITHCAPHVKDALFAARLDHFFKVS